MKIVLQAMNIAIILLWIYLVLFAFTIAYSALKIKVEVGESIATTLDGAILIHTPFNISNFGYYDITDLRITTYLFDCNGTEISMGSTFISKIPSGGEAEAVHNVSIPVKDIALKYDEYLFKDSNFSLVANANLKFAEVISLHMEFNSSVFWGAPLYNLSITPLPPQIINVTHYKMSILVNFENHSPYFTVSGRLHLKIYNEFGELIGGGDIDINVPYNSEYHEEIEVTLNLTKFTGSGVLELTFITSSFNYGPLSFKYGE